MTKILSINWEGNGGAQEVGKMLAENLERLYNIETEFLFHSPGTKPILKRKDGSGIASLSEEVYLDNFFLNWVDLKRYDLIHAHSCTLSEKALNEIKKKEKPLIYTVHSLIIHDTIFDDPTYRDYFFGISDVERAEELEKLKNIEWIKKQEWMFQFSNQIVCLNERQRKLLEYFYPGYTNKSTVLPIGSDFYKFANDEEVIRRAEEIREEVIRREIRERDKPKKIILYTGRMSKSKGIYDLADAFNILSKKGWNVSLILVGNFIDPSDREKMLNRVDVKYRRDVIFRGWVNDKRELAAYYKMADVTVIPTYHDTFCLSALESMMMGTPVVISNVDCVNEVYINRWLAYPCKPNDPESILPWVEWIFSNPDAAKKNAKLVQEYVTRKYKIENCVDGCVKIYERYLNR